MMDRWVCPNDRQLSTAGKVRVSYFIKEFVINILKKKKVLMEVKHLKGYVAINKLHVRKITSYEVLCYN